jgi:MoaA/NifB/PqqE/SkfB family radical SAM enzyme
MNARKLFQLGMTEARAAVAEEIYMTTGLEVTRPTNIVGTLSKRCNYRCPMCMDWRPLPNRPDELTIAEWQNALQSLHDFLGSYRIGFLGGEPFMRAGFLTLLEFCHARGIDHSTTTNASLLRGAVIRRFVASRPLHLNISVDGPTAEVNDPSRGVPGSLRSVEKAIGALRDEQERAGKRFPIRIKPTVHVGNFRSMPAMVEWVRRVGADTLDFEPVRPWAPEVEKDLWIGPELLDELRAVMKELAALKRNGAPIETSEHRLLGMPNHFAGKNIEPEVTPCRVGLRRFDIGPNGDVSTCWFFEPIGNVRRQSAREIWQGAVAKLRREETVACTRACAFSCLAQKPLTNLIERGRLLLQVRPSTRKQGSAGPAAHAPLSALSVSSASDEPLAPGG